MAEPLGKSELNHPRFMEEMEFEREWALVAAASEHRDRLLEPDGAGFMQVIQRLAGHHNLCWRLGEPGL